MIRLQRICKDYRTSRGMRRVLDGVDLTVLPGERWGILGRNGAGKSTLIRTLGGVELPTSGSIEKSMSVSWPLAFSGGIQGGLSGRDNMRFVARIYDLDFKRAEAFVEEFAELGAAMAEPVKTYSSGMKARLAFALSIAVEFDCFLIDEVISVGDSRFRAKSRTELFEKRADRAIVLVSHDPEQVKKFCNRAAVLEGGKLTVADSVGDALEIYKKL